MHTDEQSLSPRFITYVRDYLMDLNVDFDEVLNDLNLSDFAVEELSPMIPCSKVALLFEHVSEVLNNKNFAIDLASKLHFESGSIILLAVMAAKDVQHMLTTLLKFDVYVDSAIFIKKQIQQGECCITIELTTDKSIKADQLNLYLVSLFCVMLCKATRNTVPLSKLELAISSLDGINVELLGINPQHTSINDSINRVYFPSSYLSTQLFSSNELLHEVLSNALESYFAYKNNDNEWLDSVSRHILVQSKMCSPSAESVAKSMNISASKFKRLLAENNTGFKELKNNVMLQRAKYYLKHTSMSISEIALELGYSEASSFCRAFKTLEKQTPDSYRLN